MAGKDIPCEMCHGTGSTSGTMCMTCSGSGNIGDTGGTILQGHGNMPPPPGFGGTIDDPDWGGP